MVRAAARTIIGLMLTAVVGLTFSPLLWPAAAMTGQVTTSIFFGFPTAPATTSATVTTKTTVRSATTLRPRNTLPTTAATATTSTTPATVAPTTVASLPGAKKPPVTLPLALGRQSGHFGTVFPILGGIGIFALIALLTTQWFLTDPGRRGPTL